MRYSRCLAGYFVNVTQVLKVDHANQISKALFQILYVYSLLKCKVHTIASLSNLTSALKRWDIVPFIIMYFFVVYKTPLPIACPPFLDLHSRLMTAHFPSFICPATIHG
jgi:hypothetical protein